MKNMFLFGRKQAVTFRAVPRHSGKSVAGIALMKGGL